VRLTAEINSIESDAVEDERAAARSLAAAHSPEQLALALVRAHRARLPAPEELTNVDGPRPAQPRHDRADRPERVPRPERGPGPERAERPERGPRPDRAERPARPERPDQKEKHDRQLRQLEETGDASPPVWFRIDVGRARKADPKWLIPVICTRGGITKAEIGAIRVMSHETRFQIAANAADRFDLAVAKPPKDHSDRTVRTARIGRASAPAPRERD
jgi:ATP-dependent RNA helicase DeaD